MSEQTQMLLVMSQDGLGIDQLSSVELYNDDTSPYKPPRIHSNVVDLGANSGKFVCEFVKSLNFGTITWLASQDLLPLLRGVRLQGTPDI